ncbi:NAD-dependent succinate-semialdehyde dehydrogenase [Fulvivirga sp.]|uniref:NAD-dependent succinate-semialdehyde dehydrogenase n=1 Tax=Fulvivirga sp. TaxID=1931237 RepID=UPI0032ED1C23
MNIESINPANGESVATYKAMTSKEVKHIIDESDLDWKNWRKTSFDERSQLMHMAAEVLRENKASYAELMTLEMGKVLKDGESEIEKCAWVCDYYADNAKEFLKDHKVDTEASNSFISYKPIGIVLAVMPWNFPFWQVMRFAAPALMAGNAGVLKHASNVSGCAIAIEKAFQKAGFPKNIFRTLIIPSNQVAEVIKNEKVKAVTLTGSTPAGKSVAAIAGSQIKKTVLELGGSDPYIILQDADLELAAKTCATSRLINNGQSCISAKRFIVVKEVKAEFEKLLSKYMSERVVGDPLDKRTDLGPMARMDLRDELHDQVTKSKEMGANCILGGAIDHNSEGAFYPPTILTDVKWGSPAYHEELFGPVASIIEASNEKEAIEIANDSFFGLGAAVFTKDLKRGEHIAKDEIEAGCCFVNDFVKSDPRLPFGGVKGSGYGRELSAYGIKEFVNIKTVYIK